MPVKIHLLHKGNLDFLIKFIYKFLSLVFCNYKIVSLCNNNVNKNLIMLG